MKEFTASLGFIVFFILMTLILSMTVGEKPTIGFLWLVLLSMVLVNSDKFTALLRRYSGA